MGCLFSCQKSVQEPEIPSDPAGQSNQNVAVDENPEASRNEELQHISFTLQELADACQNFSPNSLLGEGFYGKVYMGHLKRINQHVAIKRLNHNITQGDEEFVNKVLMLSLLHHPNVVKLFGYCLDGNDRLLVYEFMPLSSVDYHLHELPPQRRRLDWPTRMKIALGAARGLEYLHNTANPPVIFRDFKCSNVLLDIDYNPKLTDFGFAKVGPVGDDSHVSTRIMGTFGYCAPEYLTTGRLTIRSDIYSFGVFLLELITGQKVIDNARKGQDRNLVEWARPKFINEADYPQMGDPTLKRQFPPKGITYALTITARCVAERPETRPVIKDIVEGLEFVGSQPYDIASTSGS